MTLFLCLVYTNLPYYHNYIIGFLYSQLLCSSCAMWGGFWQLDVLEEEREARLQHCALLLGHSHLQHRNNLLV